MMEEEALKKLIKYKKELANKPNYIRGIKN